MFGGRTLQGWEGDRNIWKVEKGSIVGGSSSEMIHRNNFLTTVDSFENFILTLKVKVVEFKELVNGRIQFHNARILDLPNEMRGYQADVGLGYLGVLYDELRRNIPLALRVDFSL